MQNLEPNKAKGESLISIQVLREKKVKSIPLEKGEEIILDPKTSQGWGEITHVDP